MAKKKGRPKNKYTKEQIAKIEECAFHGCQTGTIATLTGIPDESLRRNFGEILAKKRAKRKLELRKAQDRQCQVGNSALLIFLGKNELGQVDKKEHEITASIALTKPLTLEEMKKRILEAEKAGTGIDNRSIEGGSHQEGK